MALINGSLLKSNFLRNVFYGVRNVIDKNTGLSFNGHQNYCTIVSTTMRYEPKEQQSGSVSKQKLSKAAKSYLDRAQKYNEMMSEARAEYNIGMRHLANMMGRDANTFTQADANEAIEYLFPSSLYDSRARPFLKPPEEIYPARKAPQFDVTGRPKHAFYYTNFANFYQLCHNTFKTIQELDKHEDKMIKQQMEVDPNLQLDVQSSICLTKNELEDLIIESITDRHYEQFVTMLDRLIAHPYSYVAKDFIMKYRKKLTIQKEKLLIAEPKIGEDGREYVTTYECLRKSARGDVTVIHPGTGQISINGKDITFFEDKQSREQVSFASYVELLFIVR